MRGMSNLNEWARVREIMNFAKYATRRHGATGCRVLRRLESNVQCVSEQLADEAFGLIYRAIDVLTGERAFDGTAQSFGQLAREKTAYDLSHLGGLSLV